MISSRLQMETPYPLIRACMFLTGVAQSVASSDRPITTDEIKQLRKRIEEMVYYI